MKIRFSARSKENPEKAKKKAERAEMKACANGTERRALRIIRGFNRREYGK